MKALLLALALAGPALAGPAGLTEAQVRSLVERQSRAWNAGDLAGYFATFDPTARFTDQALGNDNSIVPYGASTLAQARAQSGRALAGGGMQETVTLDAVTLAPDRRTARVSAGVVSEITRGPGSRRVCARRIETFALTPAGLRATGQTDTVVRCRAGAGG
ncbi:hypothetical protein [Phenylobacterium sp.]|uniref:hypothetical protein n=1 Tax=Phenylobacterium sp. TaxID=1871053 RepID=UPI002E2F4EA2|nr:hypothetical protein [Phenylobacterium sp.]HEX4711885.1 hypothetical protein [Phenylobacterium sp.]